MGKRLYKWVPRSLVVPRPLVARPGAACTLVPGLGVLLAGGRDAVGEVSTSSTCSSLSQVLATEVLHLTRRPVRWVEAAPLPGPRPRPALLEVAGGCIFLTSHQVPSMPSD